jgi:hypothetical protein
MVTDVSFDATVVLGVAAKASAVFGQEDTYFSYPLAPVGFRQDELRGMGLGLTAESKRVLAEFSYLVNTIPDGAVWTPLADRYLWQIYGEILDTAELAGSTRTSAEEQAYQAAYDYLHRSGADGVIAESDVVTTYRKYRDAWLVLGEEYRNAAGEAELSADPAVKARWRDVVQPMLVAKRREIEQAWEADGHRAEVESAQRTERELGQRSASQAWSAFRKRFDPQTPEIFFATDPNGGQYVPTSFRPTNALDVPWPRFNLTHEELATLAAGAPAAMRARMGEGVDAGVETLSFEYTSVAVSRPWFSSDVFSSRAWRYLDSGKVVSDGAEPPSGLCTAYVAGVVLLRNLSVTRKRSPHESAAQLSLGPLVLDGATFAGDERRPSVVAGGDATAGSARTNRPMLSFLDKADFERIALDLPPQVEDAATSPLEALLQRLVDRVQQRLGRTPLETLGRDLAAGKTTALVPQLAQAAREDHPFARDLAALITELDRHGGREIAAQAYPPAFAGDPVEVTVGVASADSSSEAADLASAPTWVKACYIIGFALCLTAMLIFGIALFTASSDPNDPDSFGPPRDIPVAFGVFFAGFVVAAIAGVRHSLSKRRLSDVVTVDVAGAVAYLAAYLLREVSPVRELLLGSAHPSVEVVTMPPGEIYVLGFICRRVPKSPNPDPALPWPAS